ncbi:collagen alpha-1(I) chain-like [Pithys albifrons albifrons]|uniref:collagen alpha-1(I) chain-like n=1 Tax=Pithys albifrons albifrons TaxID=3385563 RepID=UPI003A5CAE31
MAARPGTRMFRFALYGMGGLGSQFRTTLKMAARTTIKMASLGPLGSDRRLPACLIPSRPPLAAPSPRGASRRGPGQLGRAGGGGGSRAAGRHRRGQPGSGPRRTVGTARAPRRERAASVRLGPAWPAVHPLSALHCRDVPASGTSRQSPCPARAAHRDRAHAPPERHIATEPMPRQSGTSRQSRSPARAAHRGRADPPPERHIETEPMPRQSGTSRQSPCPARAAHGGTGRAGPRGGPGSFAASAMAGSDRREGIRETVLLPLEGGHGERDKDEHVLACALGFQFLVVGVGGLMSRGTSAVAFHGAGGALLLLGERNPLEMLVTIRNSGSFSGFPGTGKAFGLSAAVANPLGV